MEKISQSRIDIRIVESDCPNNDLWRKVWHLSAGTRVRVYVGKVKPTLPLPTLSQVPMYWEAWNNELEIEIAAEDDRTLAQWKYFRDLSMAYITWSNK